MVANDCHLLQMVANGKQSLTVVANDTIGCHRQKNQPLAASKPFRVWSLQLVPMVTNGTNGKIYNGTIGKTPNATMGLLSNFPFCCGQLVKILITWTL